MKFLSSAAGVMSLLILCQSGCKTRETTPEKPVHALAEHDYFLAYVKPALETHCLACHQGKRPPAGLSLVQRTGAYAPRRLGRAFIVPGDPARSLLLTAVMPGGGHPMTSPPLQASLTSFEISALWEWIEDGAHWPLAPDGHLRARQHAAPPVEY